MEDQGNNSSTSNYNDESLFERFCKQCKKAIGELYTIYPSIEKMVLKNSGNIEDTKDTFQQGLIGLWRYCEKNNSQPTPKALLYSICYKIWLKELEFRRKQKVTFADYKEYVDEPPTFSNEDIEELLRDRKFLLQKHYHRLPEKAQELLDNFYKNGMTYKEIAKEMGYSNEESAKTQKAKLIKKIRDSIRKDPNFK